VIPGKRLMRALHKASRETRELAPTTTVAVFVKGKPFAGQKRGAGGRSPYRSSTSSIRKKGKGKTDDSGTCKGRGKRGELRMRFPGHFRYRGRGKKINREKRSSSLKNEAGSCYGRSTQVE